MPIYANQLENGLYDVTSSLLISKKLIHGVIFATYGDFGDRMFNPSIPFEKKLKQCHVREKGIYKYYLLHFRPTKNILGTKSLSEQYGQVYFLKREGLDFKTDVLEHILEHHQQLDDIMRNCSGNAITSYTMEKTDRFPNYFYANNADISTRELTEYLLRNFNQLELIEGTVNVTTIVSTEKKDLGDDGLPSLITIIKAGFMDQLPRELLQELLQSPERDHTLALSPHAAQDLPPAYDG
ncbi:hypothetical protein BN7_6740 [Wickerhamomyces ciferrii]|uniref:Uncharacterized protein n=1 Tax=Wickerhamomyces ciferrii (strain ATCC 14091 / BCRC 22168 / CBS 111 / JCM 3599 / NBRC 0793 / NRRL Y-1031 F-60-10) TaxID=1206466 RepID=K0L0N8_WICCF|nr:uncharacterized protein BN7_6740 [Wickerhamomyces ciferrii]CCH47129.1 hypothetical protein BN7_6740 [Wickerhamomyces ciferrii]